MGQQEDTFLNGEGDKWFERNIYKMGQNPAEDPVLRMLEKYRPITPSTLGPRGPRTVEFGCANGWRLEEIRKMFGNFCAGVDPSTDALRNGAAKYKEISFHRGTMTAHPFSANSFGLVIYGFCLYVADPEDYFEIVAQGNNILLDSGHMLIYDFDADHPHAVPNHHVDGLMTYKMDFSRLWLAHPHYRMVDVAVYPDGTRVTLLQKDMKGAFPVEEMR